MVYRGKPSAKCGRCRGRGMKCDQATPQCSQCIRAGEECPGYRDLLSLLFHNENEDVVRRAQKKYANTGGHQKPASLQAKRVPRSSKGKEIAASTPAAGVPRPIVYSIHNQAMCFARRNYMEKWLWLHSMPVKEDQSPTLRSAITALGLAVLANIRMSPSLMMSAREEYTTALANTNRSLIDTVESKTDQTLLAVMFLGMFEVVTYRDPESVWRWAKHTKGAAKLIEWRGEEQLNSPGGLFLFRLIRSNVLINNIFEETYTPPIFANLSQRSSNMEVGDIKFTDSLAMKSIQLSKFCADIRNGVISAPTAKIDQALLLDTELEAWAMSVPPSWQYRVIAIPPEIQDMGFLNELYGKYYHVYDDLYICQIWNNWRSMRMVIHEIIVHATTVIQTQNSEDEEPMNLLRYSEIAVRSEHIIHKLQADIFASVPYHFGTTDDNMTSNTATNISDLNELSVVAGHILMWPLFLAADYKDTPRELRNWVITCLQKIGHEMGINQALGMAVLLQKGIDTRTWVEPDSASDIKSVRSWDTSQPTVSPEQQELDDGFFSGLQF